MSPVWNRVCLVILFIVSAVTGSWAYAAPHLWYENFPALGLRWPPQLGPYNEHLASDVGATYIALAVLTALTLWRVRGRARDGLSVRAVGAVWLPYNLLHFIYHMTMITMYNTLDRTLNVITLGLLVIVAAVLLLPKRGVTDSRW